MDIYIFFVGYFNQIEKNVEIASITYMNVSLFRGHSEHKKPPSSLSPHPKKKKGELGKAFSGLIN